MYNALLDIQSMINDRVNAMPLILSDDDLIASVSRAVSIITSTLCKGGKVMSIGNGGSAAQAQHFCAELIGRLKKSRQPLKAISLCGDCSTMSCIANDFGYERVFSRQIEGVGESNDCVIAFTTSGKSRNIIEALVSCHNKGIQTIVMTGGNQSNIKQLATNTIYLRDDDKCILQELEMMFIHIICSLVEQNVFNTLMPSFWEEVIQSSKKGYKYLLLDRDGVINIAKANGYVAVWEDFFFIESFLRHIDELSKSFKYIFVVTNQKGVSKGILTKEDIESIHSKMLQKISAYGGSITKIYMSVGDDDDINRKPNIGMANQILKDFPDVNFLESIVVGDSASDMQFAQNIGARFIYAKPE